MRRRSIIARRTSIPMPLFPVLQFLSAARCRSCSSDGRGRQGRALLIAFSVLSWAVILRSGGLSAALALRWPLRAFLSQSARMQDVASVVDPWSQPLVDVFRGATGIRQLGSTGTIHNLPRFNAHGVSSEESASRTQCSLARYYRRGYAIRRIVRNRVGHY